MVIITRTNLIHLAWIAFHYSRFMGAKICLKIGIPVFISSDIKFERPFGQDIA